ncbi:golgin subfamily B member 1 isoform X6 [Biomphalaria glabrata]|nr:golgin subfamily B member 1 isoform X6 [Biomphalaria glabrata]
MASPPGIPKENRQEVNSFTTLPLIVSHWEGMGWTYFSSIDVSCSLPVRVQGGSYIWARINQLVSLSRVQGGSYIWARINQLVSLSRVQGGSYIWARINQLVSLSRVQGGSYIWARINQLVSLSRVHGGSYIWARINQLVSLSRVQGGSYIWARINQLVSLSRVQGGSYIWARINQLVSLSRVQGGSYIWARINQLVSLSRVQGGSYIWARINQLVSLSRVQGGSYIWARINQLVSLSRVQGGSYIWARINQLVSLSRVQGGSYIWARINQLVSLSRVQGGSYIWARINQLVSLSRVQGGSYIWARINQLVSLSRVQGGSYIWARINQLVSLSRVQGGSYIWARINQLVSLSRVQGGSYIWARINQLVSLSRVQGGSYIWARINQLVSLSRVQGGSYIWARINQLVSLSRVQGGSYIWARINHLRVDLIIETKRLPETKKRRGEITVQTGSWFIEFVCTDHLADHLHTLQDMKQISHLEDFRVMEIAVENSGQGHNLCAVKATEHANPKGDQHQKCVKQRNQQVCDARTKPEIRSSRTLRSKSADPARRLVSDQSEKPGETKVLRNKKANDVTPKSQNGKDAPPPPLASVESTRRRSNLPTRVKRSASLTSTVRAEARDDSKEKHKQFSKMEIKCDQLERPLLSNTILCRDETEKVLDTTKEEQRKLDKESTKISSNLPTRTKTSKARRKLFQMSSSSTPEAGRHPTTVSPAISEIVLDDNESDQSVENLRTVNLDLRDQVSKLRYQMEAQKGKLKHILWQKVLDIRKIRQLEQKKLMEALNDQRDKLDRERSRDLESLRGQLTIKAESDLQKYARHKDTEINKLRMELASKENMLQRLLGDNRHARLKLNIDDRKSKLVYEIKALRRQKKELEDSLSSASSAERAFSDDIRRHSQSFELEISRVKRQSQFETNQLPSLPSPPNQFGFSGKRVKLFKHANRLTRIGMYCRVI